MNDKSYAVVVGVNSYENNINPLEGAVNDAMDFYKWLIDTSPRGGRLPRGNVTTFIEGHSPSTSYISIREELNHKMGLEPLTKGEEGIRDRLYIYLAGHGITVRHPNVDEKDLTVFLSLENDIANPEYQIAAVTIKYAVNQMRYYREVVLIMDCCRNLDILTNLTHIWSRNVKRMGNEYEPPEMFVMFASKSGEKAREFVDANGDHRGYFTEALVRNLKGAVDEQGRVTFTSLGNALYNEFQDKVNLNPKLVAPDTQVELVFSDDGETVKAMIKIEFGGLAGGEGNLIIINPESKQARLPLSDIPDTLELGDMQAGSYTLILDVNDQDIPADLKYQSFRLGVGQVYELNYTEARTDA